MSLLASMLHLYLEDLTRKNGLEHVPLAPWYMRLANIFH